MNDDCKLPSQRFPLVRPVPNNVRYKRYAAEHLWKAAKAKHELAKAREKAAAAEMVFRVQGKLMNRYGMMEYILSMLYEGQPLPAILSDETNDTNQLPTPAEIRKWKIDHPNFAKEMDEAEQYCAERINFAGFKYLLDLGSDEEEPSKNQLTHAKLVYEASVQQASFMNKKFQTTTKQQIEDITPMENADQIAEKIKALVAAKPHLADLVKDFGGEVIDVVNEEEQK